jgi:ceramide glucosyltransferase
MTIPILAAGGLACVATTVHLVSTLTAIVRCKSHSQALGVPDEAPPVSLIRPVCGLENYVEETLASAFALDYPDYEIIFCVASAQDRVVPTVERLIAAHPQVPASLLIGNEKISGNPKLNNLYKGWRAAKHDWIVLADSNVFMPADYIQRLMSAWRADTGLVCSPPIGCRPDGFWAEIECAFLNSYQARFQYTADTFGSGFAQGKSMLWKRSLLEQAGGIRALASELAEDAAATKVVRSLGLRVRLVDAPFEQPLGRRSAAEMWRRQVRWARLRRTSFKSYFLPEILSGAIWPIAVVAALAAESELPLASIAVAALVWYGSEAALAWAAGWHLSLRSPLAFVARDLLLPAVWFNGWLGSAFEWRGNQMRPVESRGTV